VTKFLGEGHKVKITIMFRGREMSHPELGKKLLDQVAEQVGTIAKIEAAPKLDGRNMIMVLAPDRRAGATIQRSGIRPKGAVPLGRGPDEATTPPPQTQPSTAQPETDQTNGRVRPNPEPTATPASSPTVVPHTTTSVAGPPAPLPAATSAAPPSSTEES
jgi:hypothetical protein